jgi:ribosomal protein S18 acetylase RimI-like enzyme
MKIIYLDSPDKISANHLVGFFEGWQNPPSAQKHLSILQNSEYVVIAFDNELQKVAGFINAISDNVLTSYIPLLEVLPSYRGKGIGSELVKRILGKLSNFYMIDLTCDESMQNFYKKLGLIPSTGMIIRNYSKQNGL